MFSGALQPGAPRRTPKSNLFSLVIVWPVEPVAPNPSPAKPQRPDPRRSLFWMFISFMGISIPKPGQENRALRLLIIGVVLLLAFVAAGMFALFRLW